jgi:hypothetical protein
VCQALVPKLGNILGQVPLPLGEGGPRQRGRVRGTAAIKVFCFFVPITRRFPLGEGFVNTYL